MSSPARNKPAISVLEMVIFAMFGALMFATTYAMKALPNIHLLGLFIVSLTAVYRVKALIPLYIYILLEGLLSGFSLWWLPYLYIWTVLWGATMLLPRQMTDREARIAYPLVGALHGLCFGLLYAPAEMFLMYGGDFSKFLPYIIAGLPYDLLHSLGNAVSCVLALPLVKLLTRLNTRYLH